MQRTKIKVQSSIKFTGDFVGRVTPVPIPNTEVKPAGADGTARETAWESRKSPGLIRKKSPLDSVERAFLFLNSVQSKRQIHQSAFALYLQRNRRSRGKTSQRRTQRLQRIHRLTIQLANNMTHSQ